MTCPNAKDGRHRFAQSNPKALYSCMSCDYTVKIDSQNRPKRVRLGGGNELSMKKVAEMRHSMERTGETLEEYTERRLHSQLKLTEKGKRALQYLNEMEDTP